ncbi:MAG: FHA domain-containing protein [Planctomycetaceae bacterium]
MSRLNVLTGHASGTLFAIQPGRDVLIGRAGTCDLVLSHPTVSREHARILQRGGQPYIEDLGSNNGTFVNGKRIDAVQRLEPGDRINVYEVAILFESDDAEAATDLLRKSTSHDVIPVGRDAIPTARCGPIDESRTPNHQAAKHLKAILEVVERLGSSLNLRAMLPAVLDVIFEMFPQSSGGQIFLRDESNKLAAYASRGEESDDNVCQQTRLTIADPTAQSVLESREAILFNEGDCDSALESAWCSRLYVPVIGPTRNSLGVIMLETGDASQAYDADDLQIVCGIAAVAGSFIECVRSHKSELELERRKQEAVSVASSRRCCPGAGRRSRVPVW